MLPKTLSKSAVILKIPQGQKKEESKGPPDVREVCLLGESEGTKSYQSNQVKLRLPPYSQGCQTLDHFQSKIEDLFDSTLLYLLKERFSKGGRLGPGRLVNKEFVIFFQQHLRSSFIKYLEQIEILFKKIDYDSDEIINWDEFCSYMQMELHGRDAVVTQRNQTSFSWPAESATLPSSDHINQICHLMDGTVVTCSSDSVICVWSHELCPKRRKKPELQFSGKPLWVTDMAIAHEHNKIILICGDCAIRFYELSNFEPYCQLSNLENVPLKLDFWCDKKDMNNCVLMFADDKLNINILLLPNMSDAFRIWKRGTKKNNFPTIPLASLLQTVGPTSSGMLYYRWRVHEKWISELHYYGSINAVISASHDPMASIVIGSPTGSTHIETSLEACLQADNPPRPETAPNFRKQKSVSEQNSFVTQSSFMSTVSPRPLTAAQKGQQFARTNLSFPTKFRASNDQRVFRIPKGANSFVFSYEYNVLVTGGMDQVIRVWNPYVTSKPIMKMNDHTSPVSFLFISESEGKLYSVSIENCVKVWSLTEYNCIISVIPGMHKITCPVDVVYYNPLRKCLLFGGDRFYCLRQIQRSVTTGEAFSSHDAPVVSVKYCKCFQQVLSVCEGSVLKVWSLNNGTKLSQHTKLHGQSPVSAMLLDETGRRAFTSSQSGEIKVWNYNSGQCLQVLNKGNKAEITDMCFASLTGEAKRYICCVGWDRQLNVFQDSTDSQFIHFPMPELKLISKGKYKEDITCIAFGAPFFLVTATFDGELVVWNFVSGTLFCRSRSTTVNSDKATAEGCEAITKLLFLSQRIRARESATLLSSTVSGFISFWNLFDSMKPYGQFSVSTWPVSSMTTDQNNSWLFVADSGGYISVWDIRMYCLNSQSTQPPKFVNKWKAHAKKITSLEYASNNLLITASHDGLVRLWSDHGQFIGTFGQSRSWKLSNPFTFEHPFMPTDTLIDGCSLPERFPSEESTLPNEASLEKEDTVVEGDDQNSWEAALPLTESITLPKEDLKMGKHLRYFRERENSERRGTSAGCYHKLKCYNIDDIP